MIEQVIGFREPDPAAGETDDEDAAERRDASHRFVEHVATDRIVDDVGAAATGEFLHLFAKAIGVVDQVIGAELPDHFELRVRPGGGDHGRAIEFADVDRGQSDAAGRTVHEQRFAACRFARCIA